CDSIKGQAVGVDAVGGARSIALRTLLAGGCKLKIEDVQQVALSSNVGAAIIAGQLKYGVLHIDDVPIIEAQTKSPIKQIVTQKQARPVDHYLMLVVHRETLSTKRDQLVRIIAGLIEAERFMRNPANHAKVARDAEPTGRSPEFAEKALKAYIDMEFWPNGSDGLSRKKIGVLTSILQKVGSIKPDKTPASFEQMVDPSLWPAANAMVKP
ncbi:MAG: hypothetical protein OEW21_15690, partial [Betaproteobacteria bacterium]|nr:hypothetical protein [Betaproteobacteria bacterium]